LLRQSPLKLPFQIFYALSPLTLYNLTLVPQDKTILLTLTFLMFHLLTHHASRNTFHPFGFAQGKVSRFTFHVLRFTFHVLRFTPASLVVLVAALLASFKWLSVFYLLPLLLFISRDARAFVKHALSFAMIIALTHLPWFPDWMYVYTFRATRVATPLHIAPAVLLDALGWFDKTMLMAMLAASLVAIYALFWFKRIDIFETMALSVMAGILWTPDMDPVHLSIVVIHFLLIVDWTRGVRLLTVWVLSAWVAAVYAISTRMGFMRYGLSDLRMLTGAYGSPQMIVLSYVPFLAVLAFYLADKARGRAVGRMLLGCAETTQEVAG
jgi:hypothetical protein